MKRVLLLGLLVALGALGAGAVPWAEDEDAVAAREGRNPVVRQAKKANEDAETQRVKEAWYRLRIQHPEKISLLPRVVKNQPVKISIYPPDFDLDKEKYVWAEGLVQQAYRDWFDNAVLAIQMRGREEEFADVLPLLKRGMQIEFLVYALETGEDLTVEINKTAKEVKERCHCDCAGCMYPGDEEAPMLVIISEEGYYSDLLHELGHTLGIAGSYEDEYQTSASSTHRSKDWVTLNVMNNYDDDELTTDDADGLINMIDAWDIKMKQQEHPQDWCNYLSARVKNGWNSLYEDENEKPADRFAMGTSETLLKSEDRCPATPKAAVPRPEVKRPRPEVKRPRNPQEAFRPTKSVRSGQNRSQEIEDVVKRAFHQKDK